MTSKKRKLDGDDQGTVAEKEEDRHEPAVRDEDSISSVVSDEDEEAPGDIKDPPASAAESTDNYARLRKERRLALNRESARARRKRTKVTIQTLKERVDELQQTAVREQQRNADLEQKLEASESALERSKATVSLLRAELARLHQHLPVWAITAPTAAQRGIPPAATPGAPAAGPAAASVLPHRVVAAPTLPNPTALMQHHAHPGTLPTDIRGSVEATSSEHAWPVMHKMMLQPPPAKGVAAQVPAPAPAPAGMVSCESEHSETSKRSTSHSTTAEKASETTDALPAVKATMPSHYTTAAGAMNPVFVERYHMAPAAYPAVHHSMVAPTALRAGVTPTTSLHATTAALTVGAPHFAHPHLYHHPHYPSAYLASSGIGSPPTTATTTVAAAPQLLPRHIGGASASVRSTPTVPSLLPERAETEGIL